MSSHRGMLDGITGTEEPTPVVQEIGGDAEEKAVLGTDIDSSISIMYWIKGLLFGMILVAVPVAIGLASPRTDVPHVVPSGLTAEQLTDPVQVYSLWYTCYGPVILFFALQIVVASMAAPALGYDMIEERSPDVKIKESMRSNLTSQGLISALYLTIVAAMLQADPPTDEVGALINQWYGCLLIIATFLTMVSLSVSIICLIYIEPLSDNATLHLISYGLMYFGEPMSLCACAFIDATIAMALWVFGKYGLGVGLIGCTALLYCITRVYVVYNYFAAWKNDELDADARRVREEWKAQHMHVGTISKDDVKQVTRGKAVKPSVKL